MVGKKTTEHDSGKYKEDRHVLKETNESELRFEQWRILELESESVEHASSHENVRQLTVTADRCHVVEQLDAFLRYGPTFWCSDALDQSRYVFVKVRL